MYSLCVLVIEYTLVAFTLRNSESGASYSKNGEEEIK